MSREFFHSVLVCLVLASGSPALAQSESNPSEERIAVLEARVSALEQLIEELTSPAEGQAVWSSVPGQVDPLSVALLDKAYSPANFRKGVYDDHIVFDVGVSNNLERDIQAFTGAMVFCDLFEREILQVFVTIDQAIAAGDEGTWSGQIDYNQFRHEHERLREIEAHGLMVKFKLDQIVFADGTRTLYSAPGL